MAEKKLEGLGGWLILWAFFELVMLITVIYVVIQAIITKTPTMMAYLFLFGLVGLVLWNNITFFYKMKSFVTSTLTMLGYLMIFGAINLFSVIISEIYQPSAEALIIMIILVIELVIVIAWYFYFTKSKRVKNTFGFDAIAEKEMRKKEFEERTKIREERKKKRKLNIWFHLVFLSIAVIILIVSAIFTDRIVEVSGEYISFLIIIWLILIIVVKATGQPKFLIRK